MNELDIKDLTLEQMNWEICMANLNDAVRYLEECRERLERSLKNIGDLKNYNENPL